MDGTVADEPIEAVHDNASHLSSQVTLQSGMDFGAAMNNMQQHGHAGQTALPNISFDPMSIFPGHVQMNVAAWPQMQSQYPELNDFFDDNQGHDFSTSMPSHQTFHSRQPKDEIQISDKNKCCSTGRQRVCRIGKSRSEAASRRQSRLCEDDIEH